MLQRRHEFILDLRVRVDGFHPLQGPRVPTCGLTGVAPGALGINRAGGRVEALGHIGSAEMARGDGFVIQTPGAVGMGWGERPAREGRRAPGDR